MAGTADPLAQLSGYEISHLPTHLAAAGRLADLHRLLELRSPDGSNAWYAAKRNSEQYLTDLSISWDGARDVSDLGYSLRYALISQGVRSSASLPGPLLGALVARRRFSFPEALSFARSSSVPVPGLTALLPHVAGAQRTELIKEILSRLADRSHSHSERTVLDALGAMARAGALDDDIRDQLATVPAERLSGYASIRGLVTIADCLSPPQRDEALTAAWAMACQLLSFEGRPEAQAAVAAKLPVDTGRDQVEQALTTIIDQIRNIEVRLLHPWSADGAGSDHARERVPLLRISDVVAPLRELAPVLDTTQARSIPQRLDERFSYQAQFAVIAVLPRLAQLGFEDEAWEIASSLGDLRPLAVADLAAAGAGPASLAPEKTASGQQRADDPSLRALCQIAVTSLLDVRSRRTAIRQTLRETRPEQPAQTSLRSEVISRLQPLIRSLPPDLRDPLIADLHKGDPELVSSTTDADEILLPLCDLLPDQILERRLSAIRSITLPAKIAEVMWRTSPQVPGRAPDDEAQPALLPCELVREALEAARTAERMDRAKIMVFLAPLLDKDCRVAARAIVSFGDATWSPEFLWRLSAADVRGSPELMAECLRGIFQQTHFSPPGRFRPLIDEVAAGITPWPHPAGKLEKVVGKFLRLGPDLSNLADWMPVVIAVGGQRARAQAEQALADLEAWFGDPGSTPEIFREPRRRGKEGNGDTSFYPPRVENPVAGTAALVRALGAQGKWKSAGVFFTHLRADSRTSASEVEQVELFIVNRCIAASEDGTSPSPDHMALTESIAKTAAAVGVRTAALAALLRAAVLRQDAAEAARMAVWVDNLTSVDSADRSVEVLALSALMADVVDAASLTGDLTVAARLWNRLIGIPGSYAPVVGVQMSALASVLADRLDAGPGGDETEEAMLRAYCGFAKANQDDYALAEAAGDILRRRAAAARKAGRPLAEEWLRLLDALADADDPDETLLHLSALEATCDTAAAAITAGDPQACASCLRTAFVRRRRHLECQQGVEYFTQTAISVGMEAVRAGHDEMASEAACLAWLAARIASDQETVTPAQRLLRECTAQAPDAARRLQSGRVLSFNEQKALRAELETLQDEARHAKAATPPGGLGRVIRRWRRPAG